jgi:hypothetical protein
MMEYLLLAELLWEKMRNINGVVDDQVLFNSALDASHISWETTQNHNYNFSTEANHQGANTGWIGRTPNSLKVMLLPHAVACRLTSCTKELIGEVYVWHHGKAGEA